MAAAESGPPEVHQELNLADERPGLAAYELVTQRDFMRLDWSPADGRVGAEVQVNGRLDHAVEFLVVSGCATILFVVTMVLGHVVRADGWLTLVVGGAVALTVLFWGLKWVAGRAGQRSAEIAARPADPRPPSQA